MCSLMRVEFSIWPAGASGPKLTYPLCIHISKGVSKGRHVFVCVCVCVRARNLYEQMICGTHCDCNTDGEGYRGPVNTLTWYCERGSPCGLELCVDFCLIFFFILLLFNKRKCAISVNSRFFESNMSYFPIFFFYFLLLRMFRACMLCP